MADRAHADTYHAPSGALTRFDGREWYRIDRIEAMEPFLMSVVSDDDLWMFVSSAATLTAGRRDADHALFPYETDDRIHRLGGVSGPVTTIVRHHEARREVWEPFARSCDPNATRSVAKTTASDRILFEEHHLTWGVTFRATWAASRRFGWVRVSELVDTSSSGQTLEVCDGLLDIMPSGVGAVTEQVRSNLVDAYKRSQVGPWGSLAVFNLEALISDQAEPAEALTATVVWSVGPEDAAISLDERAVGAAVAGAPLPTPPLVTGRRGAYLLSATVTLPPGGSADWMIVADVDVDHAGLVDLVRHAQLPNARELVEADIEAGSERLRSLLALADADQSTGDPTADAHHLSNVLFNSMRGGVFVNGYRLRMADFIEFLSVRNRAVLDTHRSDLEALGRDTTAPGLRTAAAEIGDPDLVRLTLEYLPLAFARRHGDPSRPWNRFSVEVRSADGVEVLSYEGNWRDIFQNWEALLLSFPMFLPNAVATFVNASTLDGHNPYRISRRGIDWEVPDPEDPWSNIGYWGDHQIVYLLRLLEAWDRFFPGSMAAMLNDRVFVYADVPYVLSSYEDMVHDPRNTITFDAERAAAIDGRVAALGADGRLVVGPGGDLARVGLFEKLLVPALSKLTSFVPEGGIWMNTQRPEWNDANNALAGYGLSMVTLYHLRRYLRFLARLVAGAGVTAFSVSDVVVDWLQEIAAVFGRFDASDDGGAATRKEMMDALGAAGTRYRRSIAAGLSGSVRDVSASVITELVANALSHVERSVQSGRRPDGLFHSYNLVSFDTEEGAVVDRLGLMLEGQVAALSSGAIDAAAALKMIDALYESDLYRPDQDSFLLYPNRPLAPFIDRNRVDRSVLGAGWRDESWSVLLVEDDAGEVHFRRDLINEGAVEEAAAVLGITGPDLDRVLELYEDTFHHHSFTGRSGSMYAYEGLGSIYWHMVAKLLVAVGELTVDSAAAGISPGALDELVAAYGRIRSGLGFRKDPAVFGAVPTDCYSHTPAHAGAQQPGMTGQVKEEIITRFIELGIAVTDATIGMRPMFHGVAGVFDEPVGDGATFTYCGVPFTVRRSQRDAVVVTHSDRGEERRSGLQLTRAESAEIFGRTGAIEQVAFEIGS